MKKAVSSRKSPCLGGRLDENPIDEAPTRMIKGDAALQHEAVNRARSLPPLATLGAASERGVADAITGRVQALGEARTERREAQYADSISARKST